MAENQLKSLCVLLYACVMLNVFHNFYYFFLIFLFQPQIVLVWRARCKNGLSDDSGPPFTKPRNYLSSCNATVAKGLKLFSQHIILAMQMEFSPKEHQFSLLLTKKEKLPKCQEIPIISAGGKNTSVLTLNGARLAAVDYLNRKWCSGSFFHSKMADFVLLVTLDSVS